MHACGDVSAILLYCTFWDSCKVKCPVSGTKTCIQYMNVALFLLHWYRYVFLCFYYVASGTYCGSSELKCALSVKKLEIKNPLHQTRPLTYLIVLMTAKVI